MNLSEAIELFLEELEANGSSKANLTTYRHRLTRIFSAPAVVSQLTPADISRAIVELRRQSTRYTSHPTRPDKPGGLAPATLLGYVQATKTFCNWLHNHNLTTTNLAKHIKRPRYDHMSHDRKMTQDDFHLMHSLATQWATGTQLQVRTAAMFFFCVDTACRLGELATLQVDKLGYRPGDNSHHAEINGKTGRGIVYYGPHTAGVLSHWLRLRPKGSNHVWVNKDGKPLKQNGIYLALKRLAKQAGVKGRFSPQAIRHLNGYNYTSRANLALAQKN